MSDRRHQCRRFMDAMAESHYTCTGMYWHEGLQDYVVILRDISFEGFDDWPEVGYPRSVPSNWECHAMINCRAAGVESVT